MNKDKKTKHGDYIFLILVLLISLFGLVMIYSASSYNAKLDYNDSFYFVKKQSIGIALGVVGMIIMSKISYEKLKKFSIPGIIISYICLVLVFIPGIGIENYGAKRWIGVGGITIQASEIAKFGFILFTCSYLSEKMDRSKSFLKCLPVLVVGFGMCILIMLEPNMSITICVGALMFAMLFAGGMKMKHFLFILVPALILIPLLIIIEPYRLKRLTAFLNPWESPKDEGYQLLQSLYAIGSGGFFGVGLFNSRQKFKFLPFSESDFILSVIAEELGFFGILIMMLVLLYTIYRGYKIAAKAKNMFGYLLAFGIITIFAIQIIINSLVVSGSIPPTGLPLPLISSGNTSIIVFMSAFGILYNISKSSKK